MKFIDNLKSSIDTYQHQHAILAFPVAVVKRYGEDQAGKQAALITYYAFLSLFPLLIAFITILGIIGSGNPDLQQRISQEVFRFFPSLGDELKRNVHTLKGSGPALLVELLILIYGARGLANMLQEAFNNVWHVKKEHRPNFVSDNLRSFGMMASVGLGIILGVVISFTLGSLLDFGVIGTALLTLLNLAVTLGLFLVVFRLGTAASIGWHCIIPGAIIAGIGVLAVQHFGTRIMAHQLHQLNGTYGSFAFALGMLFWIYLQAQIIMYAMEISAVRAQNDWPKKLF